MRALRINTLTSDAKPADRSIVFHPIDPETQQPYRADDGAIAVELVLQPISHAKAREIEKACTAPEMLKGTVIERVDFEAVRDEKVKYAVVSWRGILGADDRPIPCVDVAKVALDVFLKNEVVSRASLTQPVEVTAASF